MSLKRITNWTLLTIAPIVLFHFTTFAVAPTEEAIAKWKAEGVWDEKVAIWQAFKERGGCAPGLNSPIEKIRNRDQIALGAQVVTTLRVPVILVDFSDKLYTAGGAAATTTMFDSLLFSDPDSTGPVNPSGSMTEFYLENSYGDVYITGDVVGWFRMPETYAYYLSNDNGLSRSPQLVAAACDSADEYIDFSDYDNDGNSVVDGVIVVHAGRGGEEGGDDIWSHKFNVSVMYDDVLISEYTMNPEEFGSDMVSVGVFCHEFGHVLGLPDLYDIVDSDRQVVGRWSLMASGNWLNDGKKPAHMDAWCKNFVGFLSFTTPPDNVYQQIIPAAEFNPVAYKLTNATTGPNEYWVVENRQKMGFDVQLPGHGLCIYHVDETATFNNSNYLRYHVAVEQADGLYQLEDTFRLSGDAGDPWPGSTNARDFTDLTTPNSRRNVSQTVTKIGIWDISDSDSIMTADFDVPCDTLNE
jgi:immune inhibitor A